MLRTWRELLAKRLKGFLSRPQTRRQQHMAMFDLLEAGAVSTGVLPQWDGQSPLRLCENCYTLNQSEYRRCRRCASPLRHHPRLQAHQVVSHLDAADEVTPTHRLRSRHSEAAAGSDPE